MKRSVDDVNSFWTVVGDIDNGCKRGSPIKNGRIIRLQHTETKKFLHSHAEFQSPLSHNQEVSGFGSTEESNTADHWQVEISGGKSAFWEREKVVRLKHVDTGLYLHS